MVRGGAEDLINAIDHRLAAIVDSGSYCVAIEGIAERHSVPRVGKGHLATQPGRTEGVFTAAQACRGRVHPRLGVSEGVSGAYAAHGVDVARRLRVAQSVRTFLAEQTNSSM